MGKIDTVFNVKSRSFELVYIPHRPSDVLSKVEIGALKALSYRLKRKSEVKDSSELLDPRD